MNNFSLSKNRIFRVYIQFLAEQSEETKEGASAGRRPHYPGGRWPQVQQTVVGARGAAGGASARGGRGAVEERAAALRHAHVVAAHGCRASALDQSVAVVYSDRATP